MVDIKPSMILDAICYFEKGIYFSKKQWMTKEQIRITEDLNRINTGLVKDCLSMSTVSLIISAFYNNENLDTYNLDSLLDVFENILLVNKVVRKRITNDFQKKYVYATLDLLISKYAEIYVKNINVLKENHFDLYWKKEIYPKVIESITKKKRALKEVNINSILNNISSLKNINQTDDITIYVSFMASPTAFALYNGYLDNILESKIDNILSHELMHGFASNELINQYRKFMGKNEYLKGCYRFLIDDMHSGDEEELVMSAEYYLLYLNGSSKQDIYKYIKQNYGYNLPLSVILFELASNEENMIIDYNNWLLNKFYKNEIPEITKEYIINILDRYIG